MIAGYYREIAVLHYAARNEIYRNKKSKLVVHSRPEPLLFRPRIAVTVPRICSTVRLTIVVNRDIRLFRLKTVFKNLMIYFNFHSSFLLI